MYYSNYDDYMNSMLGYNRYDPEQDYTYNRQMYDDFEYHDLNELYPDIYRVVYPAVCKECSRNNYRGGFSKSVIEEMVDRVYNSVETSGLISSEVRGDLKNIDKKPVTSTVNNTTGNKTDVRVSEIEKETRGPMNNNILRDFIKVLLLRELIGNRPNWNCRPGQNCRPPFPPPHRPY